MICNYEAEDPDLGRGKRALYSRPRASFPRPANTTCTWDPRREAGELELLLDGRDTVSQGEASLTLGITGSSTSITYLPTGPPDDLPFRSLSDPFFGLFFFFSSPFVSCRVGPFRACHHMLLHPCRAIEAERHSLPDWLCNLPSSLTSGLSFASIRRFMGALPHTEVVGN